MNEITSQHLQDEFSQFGEIKDIYIPKDVRTQAPRGFCYITFAEKESVDRAVENPPREINGHAIGEVKVAEARPSGSGRDRDRDRDGGSLAYEGGRGAGRGYGSSFSGGYGNDRYSPGGRGGGDYYRDSGAYGGSSRYATAYEDDGYGRADSRRDPYSHAYTPAPYPGESRGPSYGYADLYPPVGAEPAYGAYRHAPSKERYRPY